MLKFPEGVTIFAEGLDHPEGLCVHPDGTVFAGGEAGQVYRVSPDGSQVEQIASTGGFVLGVALSPDGSWLAVCDSKLKCIWRLELATAKLERWSDGAEGQPYAIPNHCAFDPAGNLYFSDSGDPFQPTGRVVRVDAKGTATVWHAGPFAFSNGVALGPGGDALYVIASFLPGVERIAIRADGTAGEREVYAVLPPSVPDGLAFAEDGTLFVSCYEPSMIYRVGTDRQVGVLVSDPMAHGLAHCTNIAFGGPSFRHLYAANLGRWHLSRMELNQKGLPLPCHR